MVTGDLIDQESHLAMVPALARGLAAIAPTYYVTGNHEWAVGGVPRLKGILTECGVTVLSNQYVTLEIRVNQPAYGTVSVSTLTLPSETAVWTGTYFKLVDIPLTAQAAAGHTFLGFTCSSGAAYDKDTGTLYLDSDSRVIVTANFS